MMGMKPLLLLATMGLGLVTGVNSAAAQKDDIWRVGARVNVVASDHEAVSAAGAIVSVRGSVREDLSAGGAEVDIDASAETMNLGGAIVSVRGDASGELNVVGARLSIDANVGGELNAAGARVLVGSQTRVGQSVQIAGADVVFSGTSNGPATIYGDAVRIDGQIQGDVLVRARDVTIGRTAVIDGAITFETLGEPTIEEGATLRGRQTVTLPEPEELGGEQVFAALGILVLFGIGAGFVLGLILLIGARPFVERSIRTIRDQPGGAMLTGLGVLILVPLVAVLLMVTIIGMPVGLLTLLAFPLATMAASVLAAFALSDWLLNRQAESRSFGARLLLLLVGLVILTIVGVIPFLGFLVLVVALIAGLGGLWKALRTPRAEAAAT